MINTIFGVLFSAAESKLLTEQMSQPTANMTKLVL
jgi:hypothetical protein